MKTIKVIWGIIAIIWLGWIGINLALYIDSARSAMQASQLYDEASMNILRIITITLLLSLANEPTDKSIEQLQQQTKGLVEQSQRIADVLDRLEQRLGNSTTLSAIVPESVNEVEQTSSVASSKPEEHSNSRLCPKCNSPMQIRTATKGANQGKQFYVCSNYPNCREVIPV